MFRTRLSILGVAAVSLFAVNSAHAFNNGEFCKAVIDLANDQNKGSPKWVDDVTRFDGVSVDCERRIIEYKKFAKVPITKLPAKWRNNKAASWNKIYCGNSSFKAAVLQGWLIVDKLIFADNSQHRAVAICN